MDRKRTCTLCSEVGPDSSFVKIRNGRFNVLKDINPNTKSISDYAHLECLKMIGLDEAPQSRVQCVVYKNFFWAKFNNIVKNTYESLKQNGNLDEENPEASLMQHLQRNIPIESPTAFAIQKMTTIVQSVISQKKSSCADVADDDRSVARCSGDEASQGHSDMCSERASDAIPDDLNVKGDRSSEVSLNQPRSRGSLLRRLRQISAANGEQRKSRRMARLIRRSNANAVKQEVPTHADYIADVGICSDAFCRRLSANVENIPTFSLINEKTNQRNKVLDDIQSKLELNGDRMVNCWFFDDLLPKKDGTTTSLSMDILLRFGHNRVRMFSPNIKMSIVEHLSSVPVMAPDELVTGCGCACSFNARWAPYIVECGGLDVVMLDGFGSLDNNVLRLLHQMTSLSLFRIGRQLPAVLLSVIVSDRYDRVRAGSVINAEYDMTIEIPKVFEQTKYSVMLDKHRPYGSTMHVLYGRICEREWMQTDETGAFRPQIIYTEI